MDRSIPGRSIRSNLIPLEFGRSTLQTWISGDFPPGVGSPTVDPIQDRPILAILPSIEGRRKSSLVHDAGGKNPPLPAAPLPLYLEGLLSLQNTTQVKKTQLQAYLQCQEVKEKKTDERQLRSALRRKGKFKQRRRVQRRENSQEICSCALKAGVWIRTMSVAEELKLSCKIKFGVIQLYPSGVAVSRCMGSCLKQALQEATVFGGLGNADPKEQFKTWMAKSDRGAGLDPAGPDPSRVVGSARLHGSLADPGSTSFTLKFAYLAAENYAWLIAYLHDLDRKETQTVPVVQLNLIRLLADLCMSVSKWEVVDMILPLFIENLEEGDASVPSSLRLRLLDAVSRIACLGFEKSYRETIVLMTRSYLDKLKTLGSAESKTLPPEATAERVETLPAGFLLVASRLKSSKLRSDYRYRLLSLCSDVGLAAESKTGRSGADFLGPLLPAVAEICSDFIPTSDAEPSLLKLFRNLWFYVVLFGLAPPVQQSQSPFKSVSTTLNSSGSMSTITLQAVTGPYMWNEQWSSAVKLIALHTPPLIFLQKSLTVGPLLIGVFIGVYPHLRGRREIYPEGESLRVDYPEGSSSE
ncbi:hypothetical protein Taro_019278 [Colocasia esculenta]|uniref:PI4-kinase N-terminal domain-containing protein n=1 Tax=Colocasia esculenta TaxID=4460 RepID=A0A843V1R0_COLES|nr:hypothetical protein [Colocasia esculenta]